MSGETYDAATMEAVGRLLALGEAHGIGVTFEPDEQGWKIGYVIGHGGGDLVAGYELGDTARAAARPLDDLGARRSR